MPKKLLIISPYFPPVNAADMQRVRMSLPYFADYGYQTEVVTVCPKYADLLKDEFLMQSVPSSIKIHNVKALSKSLTLKVGLGSIALRSLWYYWQTVNSLLKQKHFDLIYFSTTQFPVCILGAYWKKRFGVPYVIDVQDPWHSDYYLDKPKHQLPPKYWFAYRLNKFLEPIAIKNTDGLISVSAGYIAQLKSRYPGIKNLPASVITFGAFSPDLQIAEANHHQFPPLLNIEDINLVYVGRGGKDMHRAIRPVFEAFKLALKNNFERFSKIKIHFIGTSYAPSGQGIPTILPLARQMGIEANVVEVTDRISYYHTLYTLQLADALFIPGSDDPNYTASKIFPYLLTLKPILAVFNKASSAIPIMSAYGVQHVFNYDKLNIDTLFPFFDQLANRVFDRVSYNNKAVIKYSAAEMTKAQCLLFDQILDDSH